MKTNSAKNDPVKSNSVKSRAAGRQHAAASPEVTYTPPASERTSPLIVREALLWLILAFCILLYISYFGIGGYLGEVISDVSFGVFGIMSYIFPILVFVSAAFLISNRGSRIAAVKFLSALGLFVCLCSFADLFTYRQDGHMALTQMYELAASHKNGGGVIGGMICALLRPALGAAGTGIILLVLSIVFFVLITQKSLMRAMKNESKKVYRSARESSARRREAHRREMEEWQEWEEQEARRRPVFLQENTESEEGKTEEERSEALGYRAEPVTEKRTTIDVPVLFPAQSRESRVQRRVSGVTMDTKIVGDRGRVGAEVHQIMPASYIDLDKLEQEQHTEKEAADDGLEVYSECMAFHIEGIQEGKTEETASVPSDSQEEAGRKHRYNAQELTEAELPETKLPKEEQPELLQPEPLQTKPVRPATERAERIQANKGQPEKSQEGTAHSGGAPAQPKKNPRSSKEEIEEGIANVQAEMDKTAEAVKKEYVFPPLDLLKSGGGKSNAGQEQEIRKTAAKLQQTLESFGVRVTVTNVSCGPSVTRYELLPEQGVKVSRIVSLSDDIKLNLAAADIRIEAPIPGKAAVGIEVPNRENSAVALRDLLESKEFQKHPSRLAFATGKDIAGKTVVSDIARMPHLLIAGATGSGKSVCINTLIMSILYKAKPDEVKLIMIDPKVVELSVYNGIPHLYIPVVTDPKKAAGALNWGVAEMTDRYSKFAELGVRDLKGYNKKIDDIKDIEDENKPQKLPQIVIIVDELADLMMVAPGEVEDAICRLAQLARAAGIHLIIATQRPSVNVITGLIKANMPSRIAFSVSSSVDSRTIIDMGGAEKLLGKGDMLFYPQGYQKPARVQGAFVSDEEVSNVVDFLKNKNTDASYSSEVEAQIAKVQHSSAAARAEEDRDALFADAGKFIIEKDKASIGMLQRVFKIGFNRAARIMDQLSEAGVVGPEEGTKPRKIIMSAEQFENYLEEN